MYISSLLAAACLFSAIPRNADIEKRRVVHPSVWRLLDDSSRTEKVWVFLTDKGFENDRERQGAVARVRSEYDSRAIRRRALRGASARTGGALFTEADLPVAPRYVSAVTRTGARLRAESRWLNAVSVRASAEQVRDIAILPCVRWIQLVACEYRGDPAEAPDLKPSMPRSGGDLRRGDEPFYGRSFDQLSQINLVALHQLGYTGAGIVIGVLDTGFARSHEAFNYPGHPIDVLAEWDFVDDDPNAGFDPNDPMIPDPHGDIWQHAHGTITLGTIAGYYPGEFVGGAYDASFILAKTEDVTSETPAEEDLYVAGLEFIEMNGADIATSSLGYDDWYEYPDLDGQTAVCTIAVNIATSHGLICCTAAGNGGRDSDWPTLDAPGDAFDVITCGAVNPDGNLADFSSGGPSADGRVKPEVLAQGEFVDSIDPLDDAAYGEWDGTSMSTPLAASAVACILQAHPCWGVQQIRSNLFAAASDYVANGEPDPLFARGYGLVDALATSEDDLCLGDLDEDGDVDLADLAELLAHYGGSGGAAYGDGDLDCDDDVDLSDLAALLAGYGDSCP